MVVFAAFIKWIICYIFSILQVIDLVLKEQLELQERRISISEFHTADEVCFASSRYQLNVM